MSEKSTWDYMYAQAVNAVNEGVATKEEKAIVWREKSANALNGTYSDIRDYAQSLERRIQILEDRSGPDKPHSNN